MSLAATPRRTRERRPRTPDDGSRAFVTPEGVDLRLKVGSYAERAAAFLLDLAIVGGSLAALTLLVGLASWRLRLGFAMEAAAIIWLLGFFALRYFYFVVFELRPGAATPGKRRLGLRVIARDGGRLTADAVFARNAMRELEVFLPAAFFLARGQGVDAWLITLGAIWSGVFVVFPLFNRDRLRLGDIAAGTMVVHAPRRLLRPDLSHSPPALGIAFSQAQLDAYGVKELHVLEGVLRSKDRRTMSEVARRIRTKIGWEGPQDLSDLAFLSAYYAGLRGRLEQRMLFGHRRKDKFDRP
ncbi:RDD family protein [Phenylobacterium sp.]|uniref:RDD family protein n=1 Tax=Phenylobacterium sp. TaxID=1871053 RepID=UPI0035B2A2D5